MTGWKSSNSKAGPLHAIKRGAASLFVCAVVLLPLFLGGNQIKQTFFPSAAKDTRQAAPLPAMQVRSADKAQAAIKPWQQPLISVTFDDGWESVYTDAAPLLQKYGIPTTQYVLSSDKIQKDPGYMSVAQISEMQKSGHEITCHSVDHPDLTTLSRDDLMKQLTGCKTAIQKQFNTPVRDFASPYGHNNAQTIDAIKQVYRSSRNTNGDITTNAANDADVNVQAKFNRYDIIAVTIRRETTIAELQSAIDYTVQHNGWLVLNYHQVEQGDAEYGIDMNNFESQLRTVSQAQPRIVTMGQFLDALDKEQ